MFAGVDARSPGPDPFSSNSSVTLQLRSSGGLKLKPKTLALPVNTGSQLDPTTGAGTIQTEHGAKKASAAAGIKAGKPLGTVSVCSGGQRLVKTLLGPVPAGGTGPMEVGLVEMVPSGVLAVLGGRDLGGGDHLRGRQRQAAERHGCAGDDGPSPRRPSTMSSRTAPVAESRFAAGDVIGHVSLNVTTH